MINSKDNLTKLNFMLAIILFVSLFFNFNKTLINAADVETGGGGSIGWTGYAVYRNGVDVPLTNYEINDHAALMVSSSKKESLPIIHANGYFNTCKFDNWNNFLDGKTFLGIYKPKSATMSSTLQNNFAAKGRELKGISYTVLGQIDYTSNTTYVNPSQILDLRCDGVVEYVYEWFSYRVGGTDDAWDISVNRPANWGAHQGTKITPRKQNQGLLTRVSTSEP